MRSRWSGGGRIRATTKCSKRATTKILADYHLRVGQIIADDHVPAGYALTEQRLDETEVGEGTAITLINAARAHPASRRRTSLAKLGQQLGLKPWAAASVSWDLFDAVLTPGDLILLISWKDDSVAQSYESGLRKRHGEGGAFGSSATTASMTAGRRRNITPTPKAADDPRLTRRLLSALCRRLMGEDQRRP